MKNKFIKFLAILVSFVLVISTLQISGLAANNENVLASIYLADAAQTVNVSSTKTAIFTVPYSYSGTSVNLQTSGLEYTAKTGYTVQSATFESGHVATIGGSPVDMTVTYVQSPDTTAYTSVYSISIVKGQPTVATFTGTISKSVALNGIVTFTETDFSSKYVKNDAAEIGAISIDGIDPAFGSLTYNGNGFPFGTPISIADIAKVTFEANNTVPNNTSVTYTVRAYAGSDTLTPIGSVNLTISVIRVPSITAVISKTVVKDSAVAFSASDFTACANLNGGTVTEIEVTPTNTGFGTWKLGSTAFTGAQKITAANIGNLSFTGSAVGVATFDWRISNESGYSVKGTGTVAVTTNITLVAYIAPTTITKGSTWTLAASQFAYTPVTDAIKYVKIVSVPSTANGYLYLTTSLSADTTSGYPAITRNTALSNGAVIPLAYVQYLRLQTNSASTAAAVAFTWSATTDSVVTGASWAAAVSYTVNFTPAVTYSTMINTPVTFVTADFNTICLNATGYNLSYVKFTLPSSSYGKLYYNYVSSANPGTAVSASTAYNRSGTPTISGVTFVPYTNFSGTIYISYTATSTNGDVYNGTINVAVKDIGTIAYSAYKDTPITFAASDFNSICLNATGANLSYIKFAIPSSSYGKLYYNYVSSANPGTAVSAATLYYRSLTPNISSVTFVPYSNYTGTVTITYTATSTNADVYSGSLTITVRNIGTISYAAFRDTPITLVAGDFNTVCVNATGYNLSYVRFSLPSSAYGKLYYNYQSAISPGTAVAESTYYYRNSSPIISGVTFVPYTSYTGTVTISYTAYDIYGSSFVGIIKVNVTPLQSKYFADVGINLYWAAPAVDYLYEHQIIKGVSATSFGPYDGIRRGDFILMLYRAYAFPTITISNFTDVPIGSYYYTAIASARALGIAVGDGVRFYPTSGLTRQDAMVLILRTLTTEGITLPAGTTADLTAFTDRSQISSYAVTAVATLVKAGVIEGSNGKLYPGATLSRAEMAAILYRVLTL